MSDTTIGSVLRKLREDRGETQREVTTDALVGIDATLLSHIERGRRLPSPRHLEGLAKHFGVPVEELIPHLDSSLRLRARDRWHRKQGLPVETPPEPSIEERGNGVERRREAARQASYFFASDPSDPVVVPATSTQYEATAAERAIDALAATGATAIAGLQRLAMDADPRVSDRAKRALALLRR